MEKDRTERVELTNMCMVRRGGDVLVQERVASGWSGLTFPGGHVEKGESFAASVVREVYEETGLKIKNPALCGVKQWCEEERRYIVFCYKADEFEGEIRSSEEGEIYWLPLETMRQSRERLASGMESMLKLFTDDICEEFSWLEDGEWQTSVF